MTICLQAKTARILSLGSSKGIVYSLLPESGFVKSASRFSSTVTGPGAFLFGHILVYIGHGSPHETQPKPAGSRPLAKVAEGEITRNLRVWRCASVSPRMPTVWALPWTRCRRLGQEGPGEGDQEGKARGVEVVRPWFLIFCFWYLGRRAIF